MALVALAGLAGPEGAGAQTADNVAVVINEAHEESIRVGEYYVRQRGVPAANVIRIRTSTDETIERRLFGSTIESPIAAAMARGHLQDRILYLVLTRGVPLRIAGTTGQEGTGASVDSELTLLYRRMVGHAVPIRGRVGNPYFLAGRDIAEAGPFDRRDHDIFLVSRLDAFTVDEALALVDRAMAPGTDGRIVMDTRDAAASRVGDGWIAEASARLTAAGHGDRVLVESGRPARGVEPVVGYYSWGSTDPQHRARRVDLGFVPGSIAATFVSGDARTFREPPEHWVPAGETPGRSAWFEGSAHSLIGDLIREGVTGVAGSVSEPYLHSVVRPDVLFAAYLAGRNLIEAFYLALPSLSWQSVVIGDPLCRPFGRESTERAGTVVDLNPDTELPVLFSERRRAFLASRVPGLDPAAVTAWVRAMGRRVRGDLPGAQDALEETIEHAPGVVAPLLDLAMVHEQRQQVDGAIEQYQRILEIVPRHVVALNNLAYSLAVHRNSPEEARPLAERAVALAPASGTVLDTLAWIEHLLGDHRIASQRLAEAVRLEPAHPGIRLHAAVVYAALGARAAAERHLEEALRLDPTRADSDEVRDLRARLDALPR